MELDDEGTTKVIHTFSKSVVDSIKLGELESAAKQLEDLIVLIIEKREDEEENSE